jgi:hypothetical protein
LISRLCDWALPWFGGHSRIWLRTSSGRRVLAWRGHNSGNFRKNVRKLQQATGLPVRRAV